MFKRLMAVLLVALTVSTGCVTDGSSSGERAIVLSNFSGQDLYLASIFGVGPARDAVPSVTSYIDPTLKIGPEGQRVLDELVSEIEAANPKFFEEFAKDLRTGDRVVIRSALQRAGEATRMAAEKRLQISNADLAANKSVALTSGAKSGDDPTYVLVFSVAVAVAVAAVIGPVLFWGKERSQNSLAVDAVADDIANTVGSAL